MDKEKIAGTNCFNCSWISKKPESVEQSELNNQGGLNPQSQEEMQRAQTADLITLPGGSKMDVISKKYCNNPDIQMYVTIRMCCAYWDNPGVIRPWKTSEIVQPLSH